MVGISYVQKEDFGNRTWSLLFTPMQHATLNPLTS